MLRILLASVMVIVPMLSACGPDEECFVDEDLVIARQAMLRAYERKLSPGHAIPEPVLTFKRKEAAKRRREREEQERAEEHALNRKYVVMIDQYRKAMKKNALKKRSQERSAQNHGKQEAQDPSVPENPWNVMTEFSDEENVFDASFEI